MELEQRAWPWHENEDYGAAILSAIPEWRDVSQVKSVDFLPAYNDVYASSIGRSVRVRGACEYVINVAYGHSIIAYKSVTYTVCIEQRYSVF